MIGAQGIAPCGHTGEHITANYVACPVCDAKPPKKPETHSIQGNEDLLGLWSDIHGRIFSITEAYADGVGWHWVNMGDYTERKTTGREALAIFREKIKAGHFTRG